MPFSDYVNRRINKIKSSYWKIYYKEENIRISTLKISSRREEVSSWRVVPLMLNAIRVSGLYRISGIAKSMSLEGTYFSRTVLGRVVCRTLLNL